MDLQKKFKSIKMVILDVDGVMTDGRVILGDHESELKCFDIKDGLGIKMLISAEVIVAIITGRISEAVTKRASELGIKDVFQGQSTKMDVYLKLLEKYGLKDSEVAYIGDDLLDIPLLRCVGVPIAVADATAEVKRSACYITRNAGGRGAIREISDMILTYQGKWENSLRDLGIND